MTEEVNTEHKAETNGGDSIALKPDFELGNYKIKKVIGQGGFGITYLAYDDSLEMDVVIKENMPAMFATRDSTRNMVYARSNSQKNGDFDWAMNNFIHEARLLARLNHPNIVRVTRVFKAIGTAYYVMPYVEGISLADYLKQYGVMDESYLRPLLLCLLDALKYLHTQNPMILHRDIKPGNVLLHQDGTPVLIDFGMARELMGEKSQTVVESPGYTPIEQLQSHGKIGPWTDIYALGGLMYNMVSGRPPMRSTDRIGDDDTLPRLAEDSDCLSRCSRELLSSIDKALALWPRDRWQSVDEWINALQQPVQKTKESTKPTLKTPASVEEALQTATQTPVSDNPPPLPIAKPISLPNRRYVVGYIAATAVLCALSCIHVNDCHCVLCTLVSTLFDFMLFYGMFALFCGRMDKEQMKSCLTISAIIAIIGSAVSWWADNESNLSLSLGGTLLFSAVIIVWVSLYLRRRFYLKAPRILAYWGTVVLIATLSGVLNYAAQGDRPFMAQTKLVNEGEKLLWGFDCKRDQNAAIYLFNQAAEDDDARALCYLAICNMPGFSADGDENKARELFQTAGVQLKKMAAAGDASAQRLLGMCYYYGLGRAVDNTAAFKYYRRAALKGDAMAQALLAQLYLHGHSAPKDLKEAHKWFKKSAEQHHPWGEKGLGECYLYGWGTDKDEQEAALWFEKASLHGNSDAQYLLALAYYQGTGVEKNPTLALKWLTKAAEGENEEAQFRMGEFSRLGEGGVERNIEKAVHWYQAAAQNGYAPAADMLGECYRNAWGVDIDCITAVNWYRQAAEAGYHWGQFHLGVSYLYGIGITKDEEQAVLWLQKAANQNLPSAQGLLGACIEHGVGGPADLRKAIELYRAAISKDEPLALFNLGCLYYNGQGVEKSPREAFTLIKKAADLGNDGAENTMGNFYRNGEGVQQDLSKSVEWYRKAADQGNVWGQYNLGQAYLYGQGVVMNEREGAEWVQKAAEQGLPDAQTRIGLCYENGTGVESDKTKAAEWYQKAADGGDIFGLHNLGVCYFEGRGVVQNNVKAINLFRQSAEQGLAISQNMMGVCYADGKGVSADQHQAVEWFRKAAEQGDPWGQYNLGMAYLNGRGTYKTKKTAIDWLQKAAAQGHEEAKRQLNLLNN